MGSEKMDKKVEVIKKLIWDEKDKCMAFLCNRVNSVDDNEVPNHALALTIVTGMVFDVFKTFSVSYGKKRALKSMDSFKKAIKSFVADELMDKDGKG